MFNEKKEKELQNLTPEAIEAQRKQRSLNRIFGLLLGIAILLLAMFIFELVVSWRLSRLLRTSRVASQGGMRTTN